VLLCTKTATALRTLCRDFEEHRFSKRYLCLMRGSPARTDQEVSLRLLPDPGRPGYMLALKHGGKPARPRFHVLEIWRGYALVEAVPLTGRRHQIRVYLASTGHPLVADRFYGDGHGLLLSELKRDYKHKAEPERP
jgi:23S rRNA pseudouridine1911/1915/1917 synthase